MREMNPMHGQLKFLVLSALSEKPLHGYGIAEKINSMTCGCWKPSSGALYPCLEGMIREKMIRLKSSQAGGRKKKVYEITGAGRNCFRESTRTVMAMEKRFLEAVKGSKLLSGLNPSEITGLFQVMGKIVGEEMPEHHTTMLEFMFLLKEGKMREPELKAFKSSLKKFMDSVAEINRRK